MGEIVRYAIDGQILLLLLLLLMVWLLVLHTTTTTSTTPDVILVLDRMMVRTVLQRKVVLGRAVLPDCGPEIRRCIHRARVNQPDRVVVWWKE